MALAFSKNIHSSTVPIGKPHHLMKILIVHNCYQQAGGEETVVDAERTLLSQHGHHVDQLLVDNKDLPDGLIGQLKTALNTTYSSAGRNKIRMAIQAFQPDIVHVHNFFPQLSPSIYDACADEGLPVVQTLHNYRLICPGALLLRNGKICEQCITGSPYQAALYGCYRNSMLGSLAVAHMVASHRRLETWAKKVTRFITLTEFSKSKFIEAGFLESHICVKPNFVLDPKTSVAKQAKNSKSLDSFAIFVGRISTEKGIVTLLKAWSILDTKHTLKIVGSGPLECTIKAQTNIVPLGFQQQNVVRALMDQALFLVLPSEWFEGFPMVIVEAFANGLPVLASRIGSLEEVIEEHVTGLFFEPGNVRDLANTADWLLNHPEECMQMGANARSTYLNKYSPEVNYTQLLNIYNQARIP